MHEPPDIPAVLEIELTMHGYTAHAKISFNWLPDETGLDARIAQWLREAAADCRIHAKDL